MPICAQIAGDFLCTALYNVYFHPLGEMHQNSFLFLAAATETTSSLMSALTYLLCQNPGKMKKLVDEVRGRFQSTE